MIQFPVGFVVDGDSLIGVLGPRPESGDARVFLETGGARLARLPRLAGLCSSY